MAIQVQGNNGVVQEVAGTTFRGAHVHIKPIEYGSLGHYRTSIQLTMATSQAANSNLFEIRNTSTNLLVLTRLRIGAYATGTVTTTYFGKWSLVRCTGFTVSSTTGTVTPTTSVKRTSMGAYPGNAAVRHATIAGVAGGMTGGTLTKDANLLASHMMQVTTGPNTTAGGFVMQVADLVDDTQGTCPLISAQNEGWVIENTVVGSGTANVVQVYIDVSWAEVAAY